MSAAEAILGEFEHYIDDLVLIPSKGGVFEVTAGDTLVFSKKALERHAEIPELIEGLDPIIER